MEFAGARLDVGERQEEEAAVSLTSLRGNLVGRAKRWAISLAIAVAKLTLGTLAILTCGAWGAAIVSAVVEVVKYHIQYQYEGMHKLIVQQFVPEPEPEPDYFSVLVGHALDLVRRVDMTLLALLLVVMLILASIWLTMGYAYYSLRRVSYRVRGIQYEAMQAGSEFQNGEIPKFQVKISLPGVFLNTHQGYGIRMGNWLVIPTHVLNGTEVVVEGARGKVVISTSHEPSKLHPDVAYIWLEENQWTMLGTRSASAVPITSCHVRCTGQKGYSTGVVNKTNIIGVLKYSGSTVPGMSGAAYVAQDRVVGMHTGASMNKNLGVAAALFVNELKHKVKNEAMYLPSSNNAEDAAHQHKKFTTAKWDAQMLEEMARMDHNLVDSWAYDVDFDYDEKFDLESAKADKKKNPIELATLLLKQQSPTGEEAQYSLLTRQVIEDVQDLKKRMQIVEDYITAKISSKKPKEIVTYNCNDCDVKTTSENDLAEHKKKHQRYKCQICDVACQTELRLANHVASSHRTVKPESAYPGDARVVVQTAPETAAFLGQRSSSPKRKNKSSKRSSSTSSRKQDSQPWEKLLYQMVQSQNRLEESLKSALQGMAGHASGMQLK